MTDYNEVVRLRMERENVNSGELHAALIWNDIADLDLHVETPNKEHLFYGNTESACGGWLDVDMNRGGNISLEPIENIFWASAPSGHYKFYVHNFCNRTDDKTVFTNPNRKVPFRVKLTKGGKSEWFSGEVGPYEKVTCFEFDYEGTGAVGSYVVIPPNDTDATFEELCKKNKVTYKSGNGFYVVKKTEKVSAGKQMILHNTEKDTFIVSSDECRKVLNLPVGENVTIKPKDIPDKHMLFVQSTSHNRKIPKNTHVLFKVSVKEALQHRMKDKYTFKN
jgi:hypothetical protein